MSIYDILDTIYGCYENYVPISYKSLINTFLLHNIPFTYNVSENITEVRTLHESFPCKLLHSLDIDIELHIEEFIITINMVDDNIINITRESSMTNMFNDCRTLEDFTFYCNY